MEKPVFHLWRFWLKKVLLFPVFKQYLSSHQCWQSLWAFGPKQEGPVVGLEWQMDEQWWAAGTRRAGALSAQNWKKPILCEDTTALVLEKPNGTPLFGGPRPCCVWDTLFMTLYKGLNFGVLHCVILVLSKGLSVLNHRSIKLPLCINAIDIKTNGCWYNLNDKDQKHRGSSIRFNIGFVEWPWPLPYHFWLLVP